MSKVLELELEFDDIHDPDYGGCDFYSGRDEALSIGVAGLVHMETVYVSCDIEKENAIKLAKAILEHYGEQQKDYT